jgi:hypothetical protein
MAGLADWVKSENTEISPLRRQKAPPPVEMTCFEVVAKKASSCILKRIP